MIRITDYFLGSGGDDEPAAVSLPNAANLWLWIPADLLPFDHNDTIGQLNELSVNDWGFDEFHTSTPLLTYKTDELPNGRGTIYNDNLAMLFAGVGSALPQTMSLDDMRFLHDGTKDWTLHLYFKHKSANPDSVGIIFDTSGAASTAGRGVFVNIDDRSSVPTNNAVNFLIVTGSAGNPHIRCAKVDAVVDLNAWHLYTFVYNKASGGSGRIVIDKVEADACANENPADNRDSANNIGILAKGAGAGGVQGWLAEIAVYKDLAMNDSQISNYYDYVTAGN